MEDIKKFIIDFFKESKISDKNGVLMIENPKKDFEEFLGEKGPYKLVFDMDRHEKVMDSELIMKGSYFLIAIRDYLRNKGQTSITKIDVKPSRPDVESFVRKNAKLGKFKISEIKGGFENKAISEFTFLTTCQYLNEKKQFITKIRVKDGEIFESDIGGLENGNKEDMKSFDSSEDHVKAIEILKRKIESDTVEIKKHLLEKLGNELNRVKTYYRNQRKEKDEEIERCEEKIKLLGSQLRHTYYERDQDILKMKIKEQRERLEKLKKEDYASRLKKEEDFHVHDETEKHSLTIENQLLNLNLIYYPSETFLITLKDKNKTKTLNVKYDSLMKKFKEIEAKGKK